MKKIITTFTVIAMLIGILSLTSCGMKEIEAKLGLGYVLTDAQIDPTEEKDGAAESTLTVAAVLLDEKGRIMSVDIDALEMTVAITDSGKATTPTDIKTKRELGDEYGMKKAGAKLEWYEQIDTLERFAKGKTVDEVKSLMASDGKGTEGVKAAGCTIYVSDFIKAIEESAKNLKSVTVSAKATVGVSVSASATATDAVADKNGSITVKHTFSANTEGGVQSGNATKIFSFTKDGKKPSA